MNYDHRMLKTSLCVLVASCLAIAEDQVAPAPAPYAAGGSQPAFEDVSSVTRGYIDPDLIADPPNPLTVFGDGFWEKGRLSPGRFNPTLIIYGDLRTAAAAIEKPEKANQADQDVQTIRTKLTLEADLKLTGTERVHARFEPFTNNGSPTRADFKPERDNKFEHSLKPSTLFFEGELDSMIGTLGGTSQNDEHDLNYALAVGKFPLELHNGYLVSDAFTGVGITKNNIQVPWASNFGVGVVYAFNDIDTFDAKESDAFQLVTAHSFAQFAAVYAEASVSVLSVRKPDEVVGGDERKQAFAGLSLSWLRGPLGQGLHVFGQKGEEGITGNGALAVYESNYRLTPLNVDGGAYLMVNGFFGSEHWTSLSGNLNQVGTTFQSDGLTGFTQQRNTGTDAAGGAASIQYKTLRRRLHIIPEISYVDDHSEANDDTFAAGLRCNYGFGRRSVIRLELRRFLPHQSEPSNAGRVEYQIKF